MKHYFIVVFVILMAVITPTTHAQLGSGQSTVEVSMVPENPKPFETISVTVVSYSTNINSSRITWKIDGKTELSGNGKKAFTFNAGALGVTKTLEILVQTAEGETITKSFQINPSTIDLIWESTGFTPPLYKGKTIYTHQNNITFIALPHIIGENGREILPQNLIYKWKKNGSVMDSQSGYGKNTFSTIGPLISRPIDIEVNVLSTNGQYTGYTHTTVVPGESSILFYERDPLYGLRLQQTFYGNVELVKPEITLVGIPLFFNITDIYSPELLYKWRINGVDIDTDTTQPSRVFRPKEGTVGLSNISLEIENARKILQLSSRSFNMSFGKPNTDESSL